MRLGGMTKANSKGYPTDVSHEECNFAAPYPKDLKDVFKCITACYLGVNDHAYFSGSSCRPRVHEEKSSAIATAGSFVTFRKCW
ncbi:hypothetical protein BCAR13_440058 [Paraburkholderia caribensis]|nr:hypothetical protein BCAR13_440058 [Paraburkholderia caribensis]